MTPEELGQLIRGGEDSSVEFRRETVANHDLAKELAAFLNLQGGTVLLGVDDDGRIVGVSASVSRTGWPSCAASSSSHRCCRRWHG